jgi:hypothetical protein
MARKLYSVKFIDARNGYGNHKLLEAYSEAEVREYMETLGHTVLEITEREDAHGYHNY